jgi:ATP-dependent RNA helicase DDX1
MCKVHARDLCSCVTAQTAVYDIGTDRMSFGFGGTGKKSHARDFKDYGEAYGKNDVIGCYLDLERYAVRLVGTRSLVT